MDQNPPGSGQGPQHQQPKYDPSNGGHYGMLPITILASGGSVLAVAPSAMLRVFAYPHSQSAS